MQIFKKEKAVVELVFQHIDKTAECVRVTIESVRAYVAGNNSDSKSTVRQVNAIESEADELLREIRELLYSGAYLPQIRGDIYRLMSTVDDVGNKAEDCFDIFNFEAPDVPQEFGIEIEAILELTAECLEVFEKGLKAYFGPKDKIQKVKKHGKRVSEIESRIDEIEREMTTRVFESSMEKGDKLHLRRSLAKITRISDAIEDAADQLQWVSVKAVL